MQSIWPDQNCSEREGDLFSDTLHEDVHLLGNRAANRQECKAAQDLKRRGYRVSVTTGNNATRDVEERLNKLFRWKTTTSYSTAQRARERLTEFKRDL